MPPNDTQSAVTALIDWYRDAGATLDVGAEPTNWFELPAPVDQTTVARPRPDPRAAPVAPQSAPTRPARQLPTAPLPPPTPSEIKPSDAAIAAREQAKSLASLDALVAALGAFDGCGLKRTARSLCVYRGAEQARLMVIGEAPGAEEDRRGRPFVGPAGQLLDKMLAAIGLDDSAVHITNLVYWRPPGNRNPTPEEVQVCRPFLERQIELVDPEFVLLLGRPAANHLLANQESIKRLRGKWMPLKPEGGGPERRALATFHPAYLLRTGSAKRDAWQDLLRLKLTMEGE